MCFSGVSDVCCKCFNCFGRMLQVVYLDVAKIDLGVAHIVVGPICSNHLLQLLGPPACTWVWRGCHGAGLQDTEQSGTRSPHGSRCGAGHRAVRATVRARDTVRA
jgi:hypothetical protein